MGSVTGRVTVYRELQGYGVTYLVLGEAHLDDAVAVAVQVERVHVVGLPAVEVGRVLAVAIAGGNPGEELMLGTSTTGHLTSVVPTEDQKAWPRRNRSLAQVLCLSCVLPRERSLLAGCGWAAGEEALEAL